MGGGAPVIHSVALGGVGSSQPQVLADRAVEDVRVLGDERDVLGERCRVDAGRVGAGEPNMDAGGRLPADASQVVDLPAPEAPVSSTSR